MTDWWVYVKQRLYKPALSRRVASDGKDILPETRVKRGLRVLHGNKELLEKLDATIRVPADRTASSRSAIFGAGRVRWRTQRLFLLGTSEQTTEGTRFPPESDYSRRVRFGPLMLPSNRREMRDGDP